MFYLERLKQEFSNCACGREHACAIKDIRIGSKLTHRVGEILKANGFPEKILLVADKKTLKAAQGIFEGLGGFQITLRVYDDFRIPTLEEAERIAAGLEGGGVLVVGTGSLSDVCRYAANRKNLPLCIFATAPSMDGFAASIAPLIESGFKRSYPAKAPDIIIADAGVLAASPSELKAAGFGDMVGKYVALIDWEASQFLTGEYFCGKVAALARRAADEVFRLSGVLQRDGNAAGRLFEALLLTGIAMGFAGNSRPASGAEHMLAHFWECWEIASGKIPNFHGAYVGVATLIVSEFYRKLSKADPEQFLKQETNTEEIFALSGALAGEMRKINQESKRLESDVVKEKWTEIRKIILVQPSPEEIKLALLDAGAPTTPAEVGVNEDLMNRSWLAHPFFRNRFTLTRLFSHYRIK
jgi:glycerol-1-phosphate dehydrogenase [NAD(P)+]